MTQAPATLTGVATKTLSYAEILDGGNPYVLGRDSNNGGRYFNGALDEVGYRNVAVSNGDVGALVVDGECGLASIRGMPAAGRYDGRRAMERRFSPGGPVAAAPR